MTLDEAIKHAEEVAEDKETRAKECIVKANSNNEWLFDYEVRKLNEESVSCAECAAEHRQLAEWLKELKQHREAWQKVKTEIADIYCGQYCENPYTPDKVRELALEIIDNALEKIEQD